MRTRQALLSMCIKFLKGCGPQGLPVEGLGFPPREGGIARYDPESAPGRLRSSSFPVEAGRRPQPWASRRREAARRRALREPRSPTRRKSLSGWTLWCWRTPCGRLSLRVQVSQSRLLRPPARPRHPASPPWADPVIPPRWAPPRAARIEDTSGNAPFFVVWFVPGQLYEVRGIHSGRHGRSSLAWAGTRRAIPGHRYRSGRDRLRGGSASREEALAAYFYVVGLHQAPRPCAEWVW